METVFFELPQFRSSRAKDNFKRQRERRNLAEPCRELGGGCQSALCPASRQGPQRWRGPLKSCRDESHSPGLTFNVFWCHLSTVIQPQLQSAAHPVWALPTQSLRALAASSASGMAGLETDTPRMENYRHCSVLPPNHQWIHCQLLKEGCQLKIKVVRKLKM